MPDDRIQMVKKAFSGNSKILVQGYSGLTVDFCKKIDAQVIVRGLRVFSDFEHEFRMALANHRLAADIEVIALITSEEHSFLSSTTVREIAALGGDISSMVPAFIQEALKKKFSEFGESRNDLPITSLRD
jgi:pantetheine-phosphate adenylyltransferase